jgi:hypothetical protein
MGAWSYTKAVTVGGRMQLVISKLTPGGRTVDVTTVRGAPTQLEGFSEADPFGDATATFSFPALSPFDDLTATDLGTWLGFYSNVDLYWIPAVPNAAGYLGAETAVIDALSNQPDVITPTVLRGPAGQRLGDNRIKIWEGFIASIDFTADGSSAGLEIQCQGALFQLDRYLQKPFYPPTPWPLEALIADTFSHTRKPHLRTAPLAIAWPPGWGLVIPGYTTRNSYTPVGKPGTKWSGYISRQTGSWDHALTGFVQDQLTVMLTDARTKVAPGNQWTIQQIHQRTDSPGRAPVLLVRDRFRTPDFTLWLGTPGVSISLSADSTQSENIVYGDGTGVDGTVWRNAVISNDGTRTDYLPLAAARDVFPEHGNPAFQHGGFVSEAYTKFSPGFDQPSAASTAEQSLARDRQPGWTGTITLSTDPSPSLSRWLIRAGMTVLLKGFAGSGATGVPLHISAKSAHPMAGTVELTVDTRYRDLLTVEEAQSRTRDPLTPVKMLQVNKASVMIEDIQAPWDYSAGSGYVPRASKAFFDYKPTTTAFPYTDWRIKHNPLHYPSWYVKCNAAAPTTMARWAGPVPILTSEKDSIARTEFFCCDLYGRPLQVPFHVSLYYVNVHGRDMPYHGSNYSPYQNNAFEKVDPTTGQQVSPLLWPQESFVVGWGNRGGGVMNRAGFWPGRESGHANPTGLFVDDAGWDYDMTNWSAYFKANNPPGKRALASDISLYAMFYCDYHEPVYFMGRLFRQNPGTS